MTYQSTPSLLPYPGAKRDLMPHLIPMFPAHRHFVSVFGGSGAEILSKPPSPQETLNDLDGHINNVLAVVRDERLAARLAEKVRVPNCRELYNDALRVIRQPVYDPVVSAAAFLIVAYQGIHGHPLLKRLSSWRVITLPRHLRKWLALPENIGLVGNRLRGVRLENRQWHAVVTDHDSPSTFFLFDPPYYPGTVARLYHHSMTKAEHRALLAKIKQIQGRAMICNYANDAYNAALADWHRRTFRGAANVAGNRFERTEVVWMNYDPTHTTLWKPE